MNSLKKTVWLSLILASLGCGCTQNPPDEKEAMLIVNALATASETARSKDAFSRINQATPELVKCLIKHVEDKRISYCKWAVYDANVPYPFDDKKQAVMEKDTWTVGDSIFMALKKRFDLDAKSKVELVRTLKDGVAK